MTRILLSALILASATLFGLAGPASAESFTRDDYLDVTARKKLPPATKGSALAAVAVYIATMPYLDAKAISIEVLADDAGLRVYRIDLICKSAEECGDDSVASTREALELKRGADGGWAIVWVGSQSICQEGRGHQDWSKALCK